MLPKGGACWAMNDCAAALIAGGQSRRMGTDKAFLPWEGRPLWEHQMEKLKALAPRQLLLSCRPDQPFPEGVAVRKVSDLMSGCGPLGGIAACLAVCEAPLLVVLGVDLPQLPAECLSLLLEASRPDCGAVMQRTGDGRSWYEPLAAVYPATLAAAAAARLHAGQLALQPFVAEAVAHGQLQVLTPPQNAWFANLNAPEDLRAVAGPGHLDCGSPLPL